MKKLKCTFNRIDTEAESLQVQCRGVPILTFNKEDYGEGFERLIGKEFYIKPYECNDVNALNVVGGEDHFGDASEEVKEAWREATHNVLGSKHLEDEELLKTFTSETPVKLYNQETEEPWNNSDKWLQRLCKGRLNGDAAFRKTNPANLSLDLSTFEIGQVGHGKAASVTSSILSYNFLTAYKYDDANISIAKWYDLSTIKVDDGIVFTGYPSFGRWSRGAKSFSSIAETPNLADLSWLNVAISSSSSRPGVYEGCNKLKVADEKSMPKYTTSDSIHYVDLYAYAFRDCTSLMESFVEPEGKATQMYYNCSSLVKVASVAKATSLENTFHNCSSLEYPPEGIEEAVENFKKLQDEGKVSSTTKFSMYYAFDGCTNLKHAILPKSSVEISATKMYSGCSSLEEVDLCGVAGTSEYGFVPTTIKATSLGDIDLLPNRSYAYGMGNIFDSIGVVNLLAPLGAYAIDRTYSYGSDYVKDNAKEISIVSNKQSSSESYYFCKDAYHIKALPYYLSSNVVYMFANRSALPTSNDYVWWVDYVTTDTEYVKTITKKEVGVNIEAASSTKTCSYTAKIPYSQLLQSVYTYEPDFELTGISEVSNMYTTGSNYDTSTPITVTPNEEDKTLDVAFAVKNIEDGLVTQIQLWTGNGDSYVPNFTYVANIDGHEFHGKTKVKVSLNVQWQLEEDVDYSVELIDEE